MADNRSIQIHRNEHNIAIVYSISDECSDGSMQITDESIKIPGSASDWLTFISNANNRITLKAKSNPNEADRGTIVTIEPFINNGERCSGFNAAQVKIVQKGFGVTCACSSLTSSYLDGLTIPANAMQSYNIYNFDSACKDLFTFEVDGTVEETIKNSDSFNISTKQNTSMREEYITIKPYFNNELCSDKVVPIKQLPLAIQTLNCCQFLNKVNLESTTIPASGDSGVTIYEIGKSGCTFTPMVYVNGYRNDDESIVKIFSGANNTIKAQVSENVGGERNIKVDMMYGGVSCGKSQEFTQLANSSSSNTCGKIQKVQDSFTNVSSSGGKRLALYTLPNPSDFNLFNYTVGGDIKFDGQAYLKDGEFVVFTVGENEYNRDISGTVYPYYIQDGNIVSCTDNTVTIYQNGKTSEYTCDSFVCYGNASGRNVSSNSQWVEVFTSNDESVLNTIEITSSPSTAVTSTGITNGTFKVEITENGTTGPKSIVITPKIANKTCDDRKFTITQAKQGTSADCSKINFVRDSYTAITSDATKITAYTGTNLTSFTFSVTQGDVTAVTTNAYDDNVVLNVHSNGGTNPRTIMVTPMVEGTMCSEKAFTITQDGTNVGPTPSDTGCSMATCNQIIQFSESKLVLDDFGNVTEETEDWAFRIPNDEYSNFEIVGDTSEYWINIYTGDTLGIMNTTTVYVSCNQNLPTNVSQGRSAEIRLQYKGNECGTSYITRIDQIDTRCQPSDITVNLYNYNGSSYELTPCGWNHSDIHDDTVSGEGIGSISIRNCTPSREFKDKIKVFPSNFGEQWPEGFSASVNWDKGETGIIFVQYPCNASSKDLTVELAVYYKDEENQIQKISDDYRLVQPALNVFKYGRVNDTPIPATGSSNYGLVSMLQWSDYLYKAGGLRTGITVTEGSEWLTAQLVEHHMYGEYTYEITCTASEAYSFESGRTGTVVVTAQTDDYVCCGEDIESAMTVTQIAHKVSITEVLVNDIPTGGSDDWSEAVKYSFDTITTNTDFWDGFSANVDTTDYPWITAWQVNYNAIEHTCSIEIKCEAGNNTGKVQLLYGTKLIAETDVEQA